jgi:hypothetical protein
VRTGLRCILVSLALVAGGCGSDERPPDERPPDVRLPASAPASKTSRVVVVVMENKEYEQVIGSDDAPFLTRLGQRYASAERMFGIRHPSLPNYIALMAGGTHGIESNCTDCETGARSLVDQLEAKGRTWKGYMQGMPRPCFLGASHGQYVKKHNPFAYFTRITKRPERCARIVPMHELGRDMRTGGLPDFVFITPDECADTHDCPIRTGDRFLAKLVPPLMRQLGPRGFLVVTYDEGVTNDGCCGVAKGGKIPTVIAGPSVRRGATGGGPYTLYSLLRAFEDFYGVPYLGEAANARPLDALFSRAP